jgi:POT family proton-dependent oligopeptide transporter
MLIGLSTGGLKSCIASLCGEQNTDTFERLGTLETGEVVVVDPKLTTSRKFPW